ncbi:hypothetical protein [Chromobacterium haemolyticum]|uniref:hypothetical protein n=1 Tax=Chromobacterium haemolyticum TaxID=394935 RepID=UPI0013178EAF|nr:hypothetical protein [Chromobacterium haemolyticum]BBH13395.1 hypothetical protein CH06BL_26430 [Chromobacterium haemolyticum]
MSAQHFQSPTDTLIAWAKQQMAETKQPLTKFSEALTDNYLAMTPEARRTCPLDEIPLDGSTDEFYAIKAKNALAVERWIKRAIKIPLEILDAWVATLEGKYRDGCLADLLKVHGMLAVANDTTADAATLGATMRTTADLFVHLAEIIADGKVDHDDREQIKHARQAMRQIAGQLAGWELEFAKVDDAQQVRG